MELAALERLEKSSSTYNGRNVVNTLGPSFLDGSSSFLQVTRTTIKAWVFDDSSSFLQVTFKGQPIKAWMSLKFNKIEPETAELAALERLEKSP